MSHISLADLAPWPTHESTEPAADRFDFVRAAAIAAGLIDRQTVDGPDGPDHWKTTTVTHDDLVKLRACAVVEGRKGINKRIGVAGPFSDYAGTASRFHVTHPARARRTVFACIDRHLERLAAR